jgi:hypothetical protein
MEDEKVIAPVPQHDNRYRVHRSARIYGLNAYFAGARAPSLSFQEGMERTVYINDVGQEMVTYDNNLRQLHGADLMSELIDLTITRRGSVYVMGKEITTLDNVVCHSFFLLSYMNHKEETWAKLQRMLKRFRRERRAEIADE